MSENEQRTKLSYESLSKFVGEEWKLDADVISTLLNHSSFLNTPPVTARLGKSQGENGDEWSESTVEFVHLGQGWVEETTNYQAGGGAWRDYKSTGRVISLLAGLLPFATWNASSSTWKSDAPQSDFGGARIIEISSISGQLFPMELGRTMSVDVVRSHWKAAEPSSQSLMWEVTRTVNGHSVGLTSDESVFEVISTVTTFYENPTGIHSEENRFYYVPSLGIAVRSGQYSSEYSGIRLRWTTLE